VETGSAFVECAVLHLALACVRYVERILELLLDGREGRMTANKLVSKILVGYFKVFFGNTREKRWSQ
jgi:hypothetical protein